MVSDIVENAAVEKLRYALKVKQLNDELLEQLTSSLRWLIHYSDKYGIVLPEKNRIIILIGRVLEIEAKLPTSSEQPNRNTSKGNTTTSVVTTNILVIF